MKKWLCIVTLAAMCVTLAGWNVAAQKVAQAPAADDGVAVTAPVEEAKEPASYPISVEKALGIAADYFGIEPGTIDSKTGYEMSYRIIHVPAAEEPYYTVALQWLVMVDGQPSHQSVLDTLTIMSYRPKVAVSAE